MSTTGAPTILSPSNAAAGRGGGPRGGGPEGSCWGSGGGTRRSAGAGSAAAGRTLGMRESDAPHVTQKRYSLGFGDWHCGQTTAAGAWGLWDSPLATP